ncbi:MAG: hypothetical protein ACYC4L_18645 [Chloroflexota bacterium]
MNTDHEIIDGLSLELDAERVLRYLEAGASPTTAVREGVDRLREEARSLLAPRAVWRLVPVEGIADGMVSLAGGQRFTSKKLSALLAGAESLGVMVGTIGDRLEEEVSRLFASAEYMEALTLDAIGTVAVEEVCQQIRSLICRCHADPAGWRVGPSLGPGYQYWDVREQEVVFTLLPAASIDVQLTESCLMLPRKSLSAIVPLGRQLRITADEEEPPCRYCDRRDCPGRIRDLTKEVG